MYELKIIITPADLIALGYCTMAGFERSKEMLDDGMKKAILALSQKIMDAEKPAVPEQ